MQIYHVWNRKLHFISCTAAEIMSVYHEDKTLILDHLLAYYWLKSLLFVCCIQIKKHRKADKPINLHNILFYIQISQAWLGTVHFGLKTDENKIQKMWQNEEVTTGK